MSGSQMQPGTAAYGLFSTDVDLVQAVNALIAAGFPAPDICLVVTPAHPICEAVRGARIVDATLPATGGFLDTVGWLSRLGAVVIPGLGFFVGSRLFLKLLIENADPSGEGVLGGLGLPEGFIDRYRRRLREDSFLVFVSCREPARAVWAREVLAGLKAEEAHVLGGAGLAKGDCACA
jgi:hypothetical protein